MCPLDRCSIVFHGGEANGLRREACSRPTAQWWSPGSTRTSRRWSRPAESSAKVGPRSLFSGFAILDWDFCRETESKHRNIFFWGGSSKFEPPQVPDVPSKELKPQSFQWNPPIFQEKSRNALFLSRVRGSEPNRFEASKDQLGWWKKTALSI